MSDCECESVMFEIEELAPVPNSHVLADAASSRFPLQSSKELPFEY